MAIGKGDTVVRHEHRKSTVYDERCPGRRVSRPDVEELPLQTEIASGGVDHDHEVTSMMVYLHGRTVRTREFGD